MITPAQVAAENQSPALTTIQTQNLMLLVKRYSVYVSNLGLFPGLEDMLAAEIVTPTEKTQFLKAILTAVDALPEVVVESQGRSDAPSHFATSENWNALALDVLNLFFNVPADIVSHQSFALAKPTDVNDMLNDKREFANSVRTNLRSPLDPFRRRGIF